MAKKTTTAKTKTTRNIGQYHNEVELLAYNNYITRVNTNKAGCDTDDWYNAESEIKKKYKIK